MFPVVLLLGMTGVLTGILQSYDEFSIPALAPVVWNAVILALLVLLHNNFGHGNGVYAYAIAWLVATVVQLLLIASALRRIDYRLAFQIDWRDPRIRQVFTLMLPVTIGLGIVNLDALINSTMGALVPAWTQGNGPRAIQLAFLLYMLPQGVFSVAVSTVLFPTLSRQAARRAAGEMRHTLGNGMRQIIPAADPVGGRNDGAGPADHAAVVHARRSSTPLSLHLTSEALFWFAWSLPFAGLNLLMTRTFFALAAALDPDQARGDQHDRRHRRQRRALQAIRHRRSGDRHRRRQHRHGVPAVPAPADRLQRPPRRGQTLMITARILVASVLTAAIARGAWALLNSVLGTLAVRPAVSVGVAVIVGAGFYVWAICHMRIPEWEQIRAMITRPPPAVSA